MGKASNLKSRLSTYNKSEEHEVIYYQSCGTKENMDIIEKIILMKLEKYKEKVNRERVILPSDKNINFFKNIINDNINFMTTCKK